MTELVNIICDQMIMIRNPWGKDNNEDAIAPEDPYKDAKDGFITLTFDNFLKYFSNISITVG